MFTYFVAYQVPNGTQPSIGNVEVTLGHEIDTYAKVSEVERELTDHLLRSGSTGGVVVTNWILLRPAKTLPNARMSIRSSASPPSMKLSFGRRRSSTPRARPKRKDLT